MKVIIDKKEYEFKEGISVLDACREIGIEIPTLCHDDRLVAHSACRLCLVEMKHNGKLVTSCSTKIWDGMEVFTSTDKVMKARKDVLDMLFSNHPEDCLTCDKSGECRLQDYCYDYGVKRGSYGGEKRNLPMDSSNHFYTYDPDKCILCGLCVRVCDELQCTSAIDFVDRGFGTIVGTPFGGGLAESTCVSCGNCVSVCPVGALMPKTKEKFRLWETKKVKTTCSYCGVGCQMDLVVKGNKIVGVEPAKDGPNEGLLCVKGKFAYKFVNHPDRLKTPMIKKDGIFVEASWDEAYNLMVEKIKETKEKKGPRALAGLTSARCSNEENYLYQKLFRAVIGTNSVDHCARL